jgi:hypothetical protein
MQRRQSSGAAADTAVLHTACRRLERELGCSSERAFDLLYGAASSQGGGLYELAGIIARASDVKPYVLALEKYRAS